MGKWFFFLLGMLFWTVLSGWRSPWLLVLGAGVSFVAIRIVMPHIDPGRMVFFILKLPLFFLEALRQAFTLLVRLYNHPSQLLWESTPTGEEELFEKTVLITLTPYTLVVKEEKGELLIHSIKEEKGH
jgi:multicomponent Na+:H+ antiporter subunit E